MGMSSASLFASGTKPMQSMAPASTRIVMRLARPSALRVKLTATITMHRGMGIWAIQAGRNGATFMRLARSAEISSKQAMTNPAETATAREV